MASFFLPYPTLLGTPHPLPSLPPSSSLSSSLSSLSSSLSSSSSSSSYSPSWVRHHHRIRPHKLAWVRFRLGAYTSDDEWGEGREREEKQKEEREEAQGEGEEEGEGEGEEIIEMGKIKQALVDSFYGTERGLKASAETRAEIAELVAQIEAVNPTPAPTQALELLNGTWILAYTSFSELFPLLAVGTLPLVQVGEISQTIDSTSLTVENVVSLKGPLATRPLSAKASFEVQSPKRVQIKFEEGVIGTPQLIDSIEMPENLEFMGQKFDLQPIQGPLRSLQDATSSLLARTILRQPPLKFPIRNERAKSWLITTYLDDDLRISRGDGGSVFVLIKQGSPLLTS